MNEKTQRLSKVPFVIGGLSFIPLLGVVFGLIAIVWGLATRKIGGAKVALLGASGIAFTALLYGSLYYYGFVQQGGVYDDLRRKLAQTTLNQLVQSVEFYKTTHGSYPTSLEALQKSQPNASLVFIADPTLSKSSATPKNFFYERVGDNNYYLRGLGADEIPFTADDIVPQVETSALPKIGLLLERRAN